MVTSQCTEHIKLPHLRQGNQRNYPIPVQPKYCKSQQSSRTPHNRTAVARQSKPRPPAAVGQCGSRDPCLHSSSARQAGPVAYFIFYSNEHRHKHCFRWPGLPVPDTHCYLGQKASTKRFCFRQDEIQQLKALPLKGCLDETSNYPAASTGEGLSWE